MSGAGNLFFEAGKALLAALDRHARENDPAKLLEGEDDEVAGRWACSAVKLKTADKWLVVASESVQVDGPMRRVRAFEGGALTGRAKYYSWAWLQQNAEAVALGSLVVGSGEGADAHFADGAGGVRTLVVRDDSSGGSYTVDVTTDDGVQTMGLGAALTLVGATMTRLDGAAGAQDEERRMEFEVADGGPAVAKARKVVACFEELGCDGSDTFASTLPPAYIYIYVGGQ